MAKANELQYHSVVDGLNPPHAMMRFEPLSAIVQAATNHHQ
jgi:hypothetical protein